MTKYQECFAEMLARHRSEFEEFGKIHNEYKTDREKWQEKFNEAGRPIVRIIEETENRLCSRMEGSGRSRYSSNLSEKFRQEVRKAFPLIDLVGVKVN